MSKFGPHHTALNIQATVQRTNTSTMAVKFGENELAHVLVEHRHSTVDWPITNISVGGLFCVSLGLVLVWSSPLLALQSSFNE